MEINENELKTNKTLNKYNHKLFIRISLKKMQHKKKNSDPKHVEMLTKQVQKYAKLNNS